MGEMLRNYDYKNEAGSSDDPPTEDMVADPWASGRDQTVAPHAQQPTTQPYVLPRQQLVGPPKYRDIRYAANVVKSVSDATIVILEIYPEEGRVTSKFCELTSQSTATCTRTS